MTILSFLAITALHLTLAPEQDDTPLTAPGTVANRDLTAGERHAYRISLRTGDRLYALVAQQGIDVTIRVLSPRAQTLAELNDQKGVSESERYALVASEEGEYSILVLGSEKAQVPGRYEAAFDIVVPGSTASESRMAAFESHFEAERLRLLGTPDGRRAAQPKYLEAIAVWQSIGDPLKEARALHGLGIATRQLEEHEAALERLSQAAEAYRRAGNPRGEAQALAAGCWSYTRRSQMQNARKCLSEALERYRAIGSRQGEAWSLSGLGSVAGNMGDHPAAIEYLSAALPIHRELKDRVEEGHTLNSLGTVYERMGRLQEALNEFGRTLEVAAALNDIELQGYALNNIGEIYRGLGDPEAARRNFVESRARFAALTDKWQRAPEAIVLSNIGRAHEMLGDYSSALRYLGMALAMSREASDRRGEGLTLQKIGFVHERRGDLSAALASHEEALRQFRLISENQRAADTLRSLGDVRQAQGELSLALDLYNQALTLQRGMGDRRSEAATLFGLARAWREKGDLPQARVQIEAALAIVEALRGDIVSADLRATYLGSTRDYYDLYIDILMSLGLEAEAFQASERARARALLDTLVAARAVEQGDDPGQRQAALTQTQPLTLDQIQKTVLDEQTVLLEYALGEKRSFVWAVTTKSLTSHVLPARAEIEAVARAVYAALTTQRLKTPDGTLPAAYRRAATALGRTLLTPVNKELAGKRLVVVTEGALQYVPLGSLGLPESGPSFKPVITDHEVTYSPSASVLAILRREGQARTPARRAVAVLADPVFRGDDPRVTGKTPSRAPEARNIMVLRSAAQSGLSAFERLPESRVEADRIVRLASPGESLRAIDFDASRRTVTSGRLSGHRIVHFATHGLLNSERPEMSGLVLSLVDASGQPQEGFLRLSDVYELRLDADLVVLSACQTALGKDVRGEGLLGLTRGFMHAGAPRVVASLWRVDDRATAELMGRFYKKLLAGGLTAAAALREAQLSMYQDPRWKSPEYWAGFVLQGEWR